MRRVIIIGAGPVGALGARLLALAGCEVSLVESSNAQRASVPELNEAAVLANPRAYALSPGSIKLLKDAGVWDGIQEAAPCPYRGMYVWDRNGVSSIQFDAEDAGFVQLGFIVQHDVLMRHLLSDLEQLPAINLIQDAKPESLHTSASSACVRLSSGEQLDAELIIGADGVTSWVREAAGLQAKQQSYGQTAVVTPARLCDWQPGAAAQVFSHQGVLGVLPISTTDPDLKLLIWSTETEHADKLLAAGDAELASAVSDALELEAARVEITGTRMSFPLTRLLATTWVKPGLALAGDAAHHIHPLAGQGLNLGFADVGTLARKIEQATDRGDHIGNMRWLRSYQNIRLPQTVVMASFIDALRLAYRQQGPVMTTLRNQILALANNSDSAKSAIMRLASGYLN